MQPLSKPANVKTELPTYVLGMLVYGAIGGFLVAWVTFGDIVVASCLVPAAIGAMGLVLLLERQFLATHFLTPAAAWQRKTGLAILLAVMGYLTFNALSDANWPLLAIWLFSIGCVLLRVKIKT